jgi:sorbitol/mannitol transport system substrate-binding protein
LTLKSIETADPNNATVEKVPYTGIQFVGIPEWQAIGTTAGQAFAAVIGGQQTVDQALASVQRATTRTMTQAGYIK